MAELNVGKPLLKIGAFGTHIIHNPVGKYSFAGTYFQSLKGVNTVTYQEAYDAFIGCLTTLDDDEKTQYIPKLRDDVKADYFKAIAELETTISVH